MKRLGLVLGLVVGCSSAGGVEGGGPGGPGGSAGTSLQGGGQAGAGGGGIDPGGAAGQGGAGGQGGAAGAGGGVVVGGAGGGGGGQTVSCADGQSEQEVYGHSSDTLYRVEAATKKVTVVGPLNCGFLSLSVIDLAINKEGELYGTTEFSLVKIDKKTAACTVINDTGSYPNSLSFVPAGTIYPDREALVGYKGSTYVVIDPTTGSVTPKGSLAGGYTSSGDIVSVIGGGTYLTVKGNGCGDCLVQVDPVSGDFVKKLGDAGHGGVFGLAYWANELYGFTSSGDLFTYDLTTGKATTVDIPDAPSGLSFYGAGSSTCARLDPIIID